MPHLEEQFPPINPLALLRPDALDPPRQEDREEEEPNRTENRVEDEAPIPGSLANGIDRVTLSANARVIVPVQPTDETVENTANPAGTGLQDFINEAEENRTSNEATTLADRNPTEQPAELAPAIPLVPDAQRTTRDDAASRIENRVASEPPPATNTELELDEEANNENRFVPTAPSTRSVLSSRVAEGNPQEPAENVPLENPLGLRGNNPEPPDRRVNILTPANVGEDPPGPNIQETRNFGEGRTLSLDLETAGGESEAISRNTVDEVLQDAGAIPGPETGEEAPFELLIAPAVQPGFVAEPEPIEEAESAPNLDNIIEPTIPDPRGSNAQRDPADNSDPAAPGIVASSLIDSRQIFEEDQETQALQPPAFPELDPDEPFVPNVEPEAREEDIPAVAQAPLNVPPPAVEDAVPVAPPIPGNVEALNENPAALRRDNLGTDPALRSNRELRNFLQEFNNRIEPPEVVTEPAGGPIAEVQNNAPPPPAVFENLEAVSAELLNDLREQEAREGVTRPEEERTTPPEPRTPEFLLTERGQNIDQFI